MKRLAILLMALGIISNSVVIVAADDTNVEKIEMSAAEIGAVEDISHPFLFGESGSWELIVDGFRAENGEEMQFTSEELGEMIEIGALRPSVEMDDSKWRLSTSPNVVLEDGTAMFRMKAKHTYGVSSQEMVLRIQLRVDQNIYWNEENREYTLTRYISGIARRENTLILQKGTILESNDMLFSAHYNPLSALGPVIRLTQEDIALGNVLANGEELYMATNRDKMISFVFDNNIRYSTYVSAAQKQVNLHYSTDEIGNVETLYPDIDFSCISFNGEPSFINSGELVFEAIGDEETVVYSYESKRLEPVASVYDEASDTVTVRGLKRLGAYVVASESIQDIEQEENRISPVEPHYQIRLINQSNPGTA